MSVARDGSVVVRAPKLMPSFFINAFIKKNDEWIEQQLIKIQNLPKKIQKNYQEGEEFLYMGVPLKMKIGDYKEISVENDRLLFPNFLLFRADKELPKWYQRKAKEIITKQVDYYANRMKTHYTGLTFSDTKSQWGSCSVHNHLQFSWRLIMTPLITLNYVVIHELAHTIQKNHSIKFWDVVKIYCPSYNAQRRWLKKHGNLLVV
jgi:predicted metal-dependent hydrolase